MVNGPLVYTKFTDSIVLCRTNRHTCVKIYNTIFFTFSKSRVLVSLVHVSIRIKKSYNIFRKVLKNTGSRGTSVQSVDHWSVKEIK